MKHTQHSHVTESSEGISHVTESSEGMKRNEKMKHVMSSVSVNYLTDGARNILTNFSNPKSTNIGTEKSN